MEFIVRGATLVNPERCFKADIWIKDEMIHYIHEHIPPKPPITEVDGSECYMLPGFFYCGASLGSRRAGVQEMKTVQEQWFKAGLMILRLPIARTGAQRLRTSWRCTITAGLPIGHACVFRTVSSPSRFFVPFLLLRFQCWR